MLFMEVCDPFMESIRINYGAGSRVEERWNKLFNNVGSLVKKYESIEDYPMGVYDLYFYLNNGKTLSRTLLMDYYRYSYAEDLLVSWANDIEDEIRHEAQLINVTASWDTELKWVEGPLIGPKNDKWKTKIDSIKDTLNKEYGYLTTYCHIDEMALAEAAQRWFPKAVKKEEKVMIPKIKDVIFNNPATIVKWADGTKTVVKVQKDEPYDEEKGLAMAFIKKIYDNKGNYNDIFRKWCPKKEIPVVDDFNGTIEEMFEDLFADDYVCESCKIDV